MSAAAKPQPTLPGMGRPRVVSPAAVALSDGQALVAMIPGIRLKSVNTSFRGVTRGAMFAKAATARKQHQAAYLTMRASFGMTPPEPPMVITITRVAPGHLDSDAVPTSAKYIRDGIAEWLQLDDGDQRLRWRYEQAKAGKGVYAVGIRIESLESAKCREWAEVLG